MRTCRIAENGETSYSGVRPMGCIDTRRAAVFVPPPRGEILTAGSGHVRSCVVVLAIKSSDHGGPAGKCMDDGLAADNFTYQRLDSGGAWCSSCCSPSPSLPASL